MNIKELKVVLEKLQELDFKLNFQLFDNQYIPSHFHITEIGSISKCFIDCGGTKRVDKKISFQLWVADDIDHKLTPKRFLDIINAIDLDPKNEIEVEYERHDTIGKYQLTFNNEIYEFILQPLHTNCLAPDKCGVVAERSDCCGPNCC